MEDIEYRLKAKIVAGAQIFISGLILVGIIFILLIVFIVNEDLDHLTFGKYQEISVTVILCCMVFEIVIVSFEFRLGLCLWYATSLSTDIGIALEKVISWKRCFVFSSIISLLTWAVTLHYSVIGSGLIRALYFYVSHKYSVHLRLGLERPSAPPLCILDKV